MKQFLFPVEWAPHARIDITKESFWVDPPDVMQEQDKLVFIRKEYFVMDPIHYFAIPRKPVTN